MIQAAVPLSQQAMPQQQGMLQQQAMPVWAQQFSQEGVPGEPVAANRTSTSGVLEGMAAWKAQQSAVDEKKSFATNDNSQGMTKRRPYCDWKQTKPYGMANQKAMRPRGKTAISKKPADSLDSGPRAVFVDLSKIVPIGV
jgi:hypothetical protein